jgi:pyridoxine/pyridoxamine 5'-phosphate oxidase
MNIDAVFELIKAKRLAVVSTVDASGAPESALVGFALTAARDIVFDTLASSRKAANLAVRPETAVVVGWDDDISVQIEGMARRPQGEALADVKAAYFATWPDGRSREGWPDIAYFAIRPVWLRYSRFAGPPEVFEFTL